MRHFLRDSIPDHAINNFIHFFWVSGKKLLAYRAADGMLVKSQFLSPP